MERTFEYTDEKYHAVITILPASNLLGIKRQMMTSDAMETKVEKEEPAKTFIRTFQWPLLTAAARIDLFEVNGEKAELTADIFADLPGMLVLMWDLALYEVNPHWRAVNSLENLEKVQEQSRQAKKEADEIKKKAEPPKSG